MKSTVDVRTVLLSAAGGAMVLAVVGFAWGGWMTTASADRMAKKQADIAVVKALAPICVSNFQEQPDADAQLITLKKTALYKQTEFVEDGGWAIMAGSEKAYSGTARACAELLAAIPQ